MNNGFFNPFSASVSGGGGGGEDGRGIVSITKTDTTGLIDTYTIYYTDGTTSTYTITNGADGPEGPQGLKGNTGEQGPQGIQGEMGPQGPTGISIINAQINTDGRLILTLSNSTTIDCGIVKGEDGTSIVILDDLDSTDELPTSGSNIGDCYLINGHLWVYTNSSAPEAVNGFVDAGNLQGPAGRGISTITLVNGELIITYTDYTSSNLGSIIGPKGNTGEQGPQGIQGLKGDDGDSAYQVWLDAGNVGTEQDFLNSLKADKNEVEITTTSTTPTDPNIEMWINLGQKQTIQIPETAQDVSYNGQNSLLEADNVQDAIDLLSQSAFPFLTVKTHSGSSIVITDGITTINGTAVLGEFKTKIPNFGTWAITATLNGKTATDTIAINLIQNYQIELSYVKIYGVEWDLTTKGKVLSRTDDSALFTDPNPYVADGNHPGSSPFDNLYPWKDMTIVEKDGNSLVKIPKFWIKVEKTAEKLSFKIADKPITGFMVSPAHRDRGDGEKDFVYIGRYHSDNTYKSVSGQAPITNITRATARVNTHNLGNEYWQLDMSMWLTIWFLYLVEFANWDSQACIGYNCGNNSSKQATGSTDLMPYHTGTMQTSRTTYGVGVQYRYIEDPWGNVLNWCDGITFNQVNIYCFENFANYSDDYTSTEATLVGTRPTSSNYIQDFEISSENGFEWFMYPSSVGSSQNNVPDNCGYGSTGVVLRVGGNYGQTANLGLFCLDGYGTASYQGGFIGVRLQCIPSVQP